MGVTMYLNIDNIKKSLEDFRGNAPYDHCIVDDFLDHKIADQLQSEFPAYENPKWFVYKNPIEDKKALNDWNAFPKLTYNVFRELLSEKFIDILKIYVGVQLFQDPGLHGGGWHIHGPGGNLNPHFDYSIHPKVGLQRKLNIIIYLSKELNETHGGHLGLWSHDHVTNGLGKLEKIIQPKFNRAVIFDTTQNSWHGLCRPLTQPEGIFRKSLAVYYLTNPSNNVDTREKALFAPRENQINDKSVSDIIKMRSDNLLFSSVYRSDLNQDDESK